MAFKKYPRVNGFKRKPNPIKDGLEGHGEPCVFCGKNTVGEKCVEVNWFRGDDVGVKVCFDDWKGPDKKLIKKFMGD